MELLIKQRVFSWADTYDVYDENGEPKYFVKADFWDIAHTIRVFAHNRDKELGRIEQRILTFRPRFSVSLNNGYSGEVRKQFSPFLPRYTVDFMGWQVEGDFLGWDYRVTEDGRTVVSISKEPLHWGDTYRLHIENPADELPALLLVLAIDAANCSDSKH